MLLDFTILIFLWGITQANHIKAFQPNSHQRVSLINRAETKFLTDEPYVKSTFYFGLSTQINGTNVPITEAMFSSWLSATVIISLK